MKTKTKTKRKKAKKKKKEVEERERTDLPTLDVLHDDPLSSQSGLVPSVRVPVVLRQQERKQVDSGLHLFSLELSG